MGVMGRTDCVYPHFEHDSKILLVIGRGQSGTLTSLGFMIAYSSHIGVGAVEKKSLAGINGKIPQPQGL